MSDLCCTCIVAILLLSATANAGDQIDPTQPPAALSGPSLLGAESAGPRPTSIVTRGEERFAVVNGTTVRVGDAVGDLRVVAIEASAVHVERPNGKGHEVWALYQTPAVKQAPAKENER